MVAVVGIVMAAAMSGLFLLAGFVATFLPGLAVLQFAWAKKSVPSAFAGLVLLAVPLIVVGDSQARFLEELKTHNTGFAFALCFVPGLLVLLHAASSKPPNLGIRSLMAYLLLLLLLAAFAGSASIAYLWVVAFVALGFVLTAVFGSRKSMRPLRAAGLVLSVAPIAAIVVHDLAMAS